jgi:hypothetical protein
VLLNYIPDFDSVHYIIISSSSKNEKPGVFNDLFFFRLLLYLYDNFFTCRQPADFAVHFLIIKKAALFTIIFFQKDTLPHPKLSRVYIFILFLKFFIVTKTNYDPPISHPPILFNYFYHRLLVRIHIFVTLHI